MTLAFSLLKRTLYPSSSNLLRKSTTACLSCKWSLPTDRTSSERPRVMNGSCSRSHKARKKQLSSPCVGVLIVRGKSCDFTIAITLSDKKRSSVLLNWTNQYTKPYTVNSCRKYTQIYKSVNVISRFRDTYLGRQVVSRPGGPRAGMGSAGDLGALRAPLVGSGAEPQPKSNLVHFSLKI